MELERITWTHNKMETRYRTAKSQEDSAQSEGGFKIDERGGRVGAEDGKTWKQRVVTTNHLNSL